MVSAPAHAPVAHRPPGDLPVPYDRQDEPNPKRYAGLKASIRANGIREPIRLSARGNVISGHTRRRVALELGLATVPTVVDEAVATEEQELRAVHDCDQGSDRTPEDAAALIDGYLQRNGVSQKAAAERLGLGEARVSRLLAPLRMPPEVLAAWRAREITLAHVSALRRCKDGPRQLQLLDRARSEGLSAEDVRRLAAPKRGRKPIKMATLAAGGVVLSYPADMTCERFEAVLGELKATVSGRLRDVSKKSFRLAEVAG